MADTSTNTQQNTAENTQPMFGIQRVYVKDISFETPNTPQVFRDPWQPQVNLDMNVGSQRLEPEIYEVLLRITVTVKSNEKVAFLAEVQQAGIFSLQNFNDAQLHHLLGSYCPSILYPYAREMVTDLVNRGGFPQFYLAPINFDAVYEQEMKRQQEGGQA